MFGMLLKNVFRKLFSGFRRGRLLKKKRVLFAVVALAVVPVLIVLQSVGLFSVWLHIPTLGAEFMLRFISVAFLGVTVLLFLTGLPSALFHFFLAQDLSLLKTLPISTKKIFLVKFVEVSIHNLGMYVAVGLPLLVSMALVLKASPLVFFVVTLVSLLYIPVPTGLAALMAFFLGRLFVIQKMRRISALILGFFIILTWAGLQFMRLSRLNPVSTDFEPGTVDRVKNMTQLLDYRLLPSDWVVNTVFEASFDHWAAVLLYLGAICLFSTLLVWITITWRVRLEGKNVRADAGGFVKFKSVKKSKKRLPVLALLLKDTRLTLRDNRLLQSSLLLSVMLLVLPFLTSSDLGQYQETLGLFIPYMPVTILALIISSTLARQGLAIERLSFPYVLQAPMSLRSMLIFKILRVVLVITPVTAVSLLITMLKSGTSIAPFFMLMVEHFFLIVSGAILGQAVAVYTTNFDWTDARYMVNPVGTSLSSILVLVAGAIGVGILIVGSVFGQQIIAFIIFFVYVSLVFGISLRVSVARLNKLEWKY